MSSNPTAPTILIENLLHASAAGFSFVRSALRVANPTQQTEGLRLRLGVEPQASLQYDKARQRRIKGCVSDFKRTALRVVNTLQPVAAKHDQQDGDGHLGRSAMPLPGSGAVPFRIHIFTDPMRVDFAAFFSESGLA
ncbi:hypothetical protein GCM10027276_21830 [Comamonas piscis]